MKSERYIYNINEKRARICMLFKKKVIVSITIKEIYIRILENKLLVTIIKSILVNKKVIISIN